MLGAWAKKGGGRRGMTVDQLGAVRGAASKSAWAGASQGLLRGQCLLLPLSASVGPAGWEREEEGGLKPGHSGLFTNSTVLRGHDTVSGI